MMGLSYESEPMLEQLGSMFAGQIRFHYVMSLLVRDVYDFMLPHEKALDPAEGIRVYCRRLAQIYQSEIPIGNLPMRMDRFCLFDETHRSSRPLNLAYKAAQLTDPEKADVFLKNLRHSIVLEQRPTTHFEEILRIVRQTGIDEAAFTAHYQNGDAENALQQDLLLTQKLGIRSLPSYLIQTKDKALLLQSFDLQDFISAIDKLTKGSPVD